MAQVPLTVQCSPTMTISSLRAQRFHSLTGDGRMRLLVLAPVEGCCAMSTEAAQRAARTRNCRAAYHSLAEAVQGSRWHSIHASRS